jgi:hypothetical protein
VGRLPVGDDWLLPVINCAVAKVSGPTTMHHKVLVKLLHSSYCHYCLGEWGLLCVSTAQVTRGQPLPPSLPQLTSLKYPIIFSPYLFFQERGMESYGRCVEKHAEPLTEEGRNSSKTLCVPAHFLAFPHQSPKLEGRGINSTLQELPRDFQDSERSCCLSRPFLFAPTLL